MNGQPARVHHFIESTIPLSNLLVGFDGSWAEDTYGPACDDTNVGRAARGWFGPVLYEEGVGSRLGAVGKFLGGVFGFGLTSRVRDLENNILLWRERNPDGQLEGIGWSRGGVGLLFLANRLAGRGVLFSRLLLLDPVPGPFKGRWDLQNPGVPIRIIRATNPKPFFKAYIPKGDNVRVANVDATHSQIGRDPKYLALIKHK